MIALTAVSAAAPVADAERAFAAAAQHGQWAAFRATAEPDAIMFAPKRVGARAFLRDMPEPSRPVMWWPRRTLTPATAV